MSSTIGIIGFGFSGLMVTANLLRDATKPLTIYIIDPKLDAKGAAYSTKEPQHLLNVQAARMGAWEDAPEDFFNWLQSDVGKYAAAQVLGSPITDPVTYAPRMIYGEYLQSIWEEAQQIAAQKKCTLKLVPSAAVALQEQADGLAILTERGDAIAVQQLVLALGNEEKQPALNIPREKMLQRPWENAALINAAKTAKNIAILGSGLTAIDAILSLRVHGYAGVIHVLSRHGRLPLPHDLQLRAMHMAESDLAPHRGSLRQLVRYLHQWQRTHDYDWRQIVDALRPHNQSIWRGFSLAEKQRFLRHLAHRWSIVRHRMAPDVAAMMAQEIHVKTLKVIAAKHLRAEDAKEGLTLHWQSGKTAHDLPVDVLANCTGVELNVARSKNPFLQHLVAHGYVEPHGTHVGINVDARYRAAGLAYGKIYALGGLLSGQLLESIAVPELRGQAQRIARAILGNLSD